MTETLPVFSMPQPLKEKTEISNYIDKFYNKEFLEKLFA
tara:strand:- start:100 stop:216 length:117 start_codon:yes stop_codon:yes gene_type:complete